MPEMDRPSPPSTARRDTIDVLHTTKAGKIGPRVAFLPWIRAEAHIGKTSLEWLVRNACLHATEDMPFSGYLSPTKRQ
jgi:hypothetical protein